MIIIPKDATCENIFTKIFDTINKIFGIIKKDKPKEKGRPRKYTDEQADDIYISIAFAVTTAEVYDNQVSDILYDIKTFNPFLVLTDGAYDDIEWSKKVKSLDINLLTDINMRRANSIEFFKRMLCFLKLL